MSQFNENVNFTGKKDRKHKRWFVAQEFKSEKTGYTVRVNKCPLFRPLYSIEVGSTGLTVGYHNHIKVEMCRAVGSVNLDDLCELIETAEKWIQKDSEQREQVIKAKEDKSNSD